MWPLPEKMVIDPSGEEITILWGPTLFYYCNILLQFVMVIGFLIWLTWMYCGDRDPPLNLEPLMASEQRRLSAEHASPMSTSSTQTLSTDAADEQTAPGDSDVTTNAEGNSPEESPGCLFGGDSEQGARFRARPSVGTVSEEQLLSSKKPASAEALPRTPSCSVTLRKVVSADDVPPTCSGSAGATPARARVISDRVPTTPESTGLLQVKGSREEPVTHGDDHVPVTPLRRRSSRRLDINKEAK